MSGSPATAARPRVVAKVSWYLCFPPGGWCCRRSLDARSTSLGKKIKTDNYVSPHLVTVTTEIQTYHNAYFQVKGTGEHLSEAFYRFCSSMVVVERRKELGLEGRMGLGIYELRDF